MSSNQYSAQLPGSRDRPRAGFSARGRVSAFGGQPDAPPLPDAPVVFAFASMVLHHVDDPGQAAAAAPVVRILAAHQVN